MIHHKCSLAGLLLVVCLASAQQQQAVDEATTTVNPVAPPKCTPIASKPKPTTKTYIFDKCIVAKFAAYLSIGQGKYVELNDGEVDKEKSHCEKDQTTPMLVINFPCGQLELEMDKTNTSSIYVKAINGYYKLDGSSKDIAFTNSTKLFETSEPGHYYKCDTEQAVILNVAEDQLILSNFAYEAYRTATGTDFYKIPEVCALDAGHVSDLVRIGVGICLVALVVIVLIAYFVGRRRWSARSSYESV